MNLDAELKIQLFHGDCIDKLKLIDDSIVDSMVVDPPYGISLMGHKWDYDIPPVNVWEECLRILKPGSYALIACGTRTQHRMAVNLEDAGFEIRDIIAWVYGQGFPKSQDLGKKLGSDYAGLGSALKPSMELWTLVRKPTSYTVAKNVKTFGVGALNIDESRIPHVTVLDGNLAYNPHLRKTINGGNGGNVISTETERRVVIPNEIGRFPANFIHDGSDDVKSNFNDNPECSSARFFYVPKPSGKERSENPHPTIKPVELMEYLVGLVTPNNGTCIDPYMGSGSTGIACINKRRNFIGIERDDSYFTLAETRIHSHEINPVI